MILKFYKNGYDPNTKYILYKKIDKTNEIIEYYKEIEKTKEELYVEELQDVKEQLNAAQEAIDFLIEVGGDVWWQDIWLWELKADIWIIV